MAKRKTAGDDLALAVYNKKMKNEVVLTSSREKAVIPTVSMPAKYLINIQILSVIINT